MLLNIIKDDFDECLENDSLIFLDPSNPDDEVFIYLVSEVGFYSLRAKDAYLN